MMNHPLSEHPPYALALATKMADVALNQNLTCCMFTTPFHIP